VGEGNQVRGHQGVAACPLWVTSGHHGANFLCLLYSRKRIKWNSARPQSRAVLKNGAGDAASAPQSCACAMRSGGYGPPPWDHDWSIRLIERGSFHVRTPAGGSTRPGPKLSQAWGGTNPRPAARTSSLSIWKCLRCVLCHIQQRPAPPAARIGA